MAKKSALSVAMANARIIRNDVDDVAALNAVAFPALLEKVAINALTHSDFKEPKPSCKVLHILQGRIQSMLDSGVFFATDGQDNAYNMLSLDDKETFVYFLARRFQGRNHCECGNLKEYVKAACPDCIGVLNTVMRAEENTPTQTAQPTPLTADGLFFSPVSESILTEWKKYLLGKRRFGVDWPNVADNFTADFINVVKRCGIEPADVWDGLLVNYPNPEVVPTHFCGTHAYQRDDETAFLHECRHCGIYFDFSRNACRENALMFPSVDAASAFKAKEQVRKETFAQQSALIQQAQNAQEETQKLRAVLGQLVKRCELLNTLQPSHAGLWHTMTLEAKQALSGVPYLPEKPENTQVFVIARGGVATGAYMENPDSLSIRIVDLDQYGEHRLVTECIGQIDQLPLDRFHADFPIISAVALATDNLDSFEYPDGTDESAL